MKRQNLLLLLVIVPFFWGCPNRPNFSNVPEIEFKRIWFAPNKNRDPNNTIPIPTQDTIYLEFTFKDGDGDVGLNEDEKGQEPYQPTNPDGSVNINHWNLLIDVYEQRQSDPNPRLLFPKDATVNLNGQMPRVRESNDPGPIEGTIRYALTSSGYRRGATYSMVFFIKDRALNNSNIVESTPLLIP